MGIRPAGWMIAIAGVVLMTAAVSVQDVTRQPVEGIRNFARLGTTVACAGATSAGALAEITKMGFASVINLRLASETGAEVEKEEAAATALGLRYVHVPFDGNPDPVAADAFIAAITTPGTEPAFIHCAGGNRAATMWLIKRLVVDGWDVDRAVKEATALGQTSEPLRTWAIEFSEARSRQTAAPTATVQTDDVQRLVGRLELEKYKATIKGLTAFGDRREGTERHRKSVDWMEAAVAQLSGMRLKKP